LIGFVFPEKVVNWVKSGSHADFTATFLLPRPSPDLLAANISNSSAFRSSFAGLLAHIWRGDPQEFQAPQTEAGLAAAPAQPGGLPGLSKTCGAALFPSTHGRGAVPGDQEPSWEKENDPGVFAYMQKPPITSIFILASACFGQG
jgi:hypothetical protein